jgi:hypothetical protein
MCFFYIKLKLLTIHSWIASGSIALEGVCDIMFVKLGSDYESISRLWLIPKKWSHKHDSFFYHTMSIDSPARDLFSGVDNGEIPLMSGTV